MNIVVLCGGKGERLKPITESIPKPLVNIKDKPILWYILKQLMNFDRRNIYIMSGYKAEMITDYIKEDFPGNEINICNNGDVDIIERVKYVISLGNNKDLLVLYGDTISDVNLSELINDAKSNTNPVTLTIWPLVSQFGIVELGTDNKVLEFKEKPRLDKWINIGYIYIKTEIFSEIAKFASFENFLKVIAEQKQLRAYKHEGHHFTVNNIVELGYAEKNIHKIII
jgi:glucose-1-phosphate cytidylyltransferase